MQHPPILLSLQKRCPCILLLLLLAPVVPSQLQSRQKHNATYITHKSVINASLLHVELNYPINYTLVGRVEA
jgi:hypothetical protein